MILPEVGVSGAVMVREDYWTDVGRLIREFYYCTTETENIKHFE
jgi:hypothetical protein